MNSESRPCDSARWLTPIASIILLLGITLGNTSAQVIEEWVVKYHEPDDRSNHAGGFAIDTEGNLYVTGFSLKDAQNATRDWATVKYNRDGHQLWASRYNGIANDWDYAYLIQIDDDSNVYVAGLIYVTDNGWDWGVAKYDKNGNQLWLQQKSGSGSNSDQPSALAVDGSNIYVAGLLYGTDSNHCALVKYDSDGNELWIVRSAISIAQIGIDFNGNICVAGMMNGDFATAKYYPSGNMIWLNTTGFQHTEEAVRVLAIDSAGNVYVTGIIYYDYNETYDHGTCSTIKYDADGKLEWVANYSGPGGRESPKAIVLDNEGNVIVTSRSGARSASLNSDQDYATIKYDQRGNQLWVARYNGPCNSEDSPAAVQADRSGNIYVTGKSSGSGTLFDYATVKYDFDGNEMWVMRYNGETNMEDEAISLLLDNDGNIYVSGRSDGAYTTIKYSTNSGTGNPEPGNGSGGGGCFLTIAAL